MTNEVFLKVREKFNAKCEETLTKKGRAYTRGGEDKLANFKRCAADTGVSTELAWAIYFHKHIDSIMHFIKNGEQGPEGILENIKDARNYLDLLVAILLEPKITSSSVAKSESAVESR